jgi:hypothetical protein
VIIFLVARCGSPPHLRGNLGNVTRAQSCDGSPPLLWGVVSDHIPGRAMWFTPLPTIGKGEIQAMLPMSQGSPPHPSVGNIYLRPVSTRGSPPPTPAGRRRPCCGDYAGLQEVHPHTSVGSVGVSLLATPPAPCAAQPIRRAGRRRARQSRSTGSDLSPSRFPGGTSPGLRLGGSRRTPPRPARSRPCPAPSPPGWSPARAP